MKQKVIAFHLDDENHWVADLQCGHKQHVRHDPPLVERKWVLTEEGRASRLGMELECKRCDEAAQAVATAVRQACLEQIKASYMEAAVAGMCREGQLDLIVDRIQNLELKTLLEKAIRDLTESQ